MDLVAQRKMPPPYRAIPFRDSIAERALHALFRKLEKAVAVSGICSGVPEENCGIIPGIMLKRLSRIAKCLRF